MTGSMRRWFAIGCAAALTLAACGGDDDGGGGGDGGGDGGASAGADTAIGRALTADMLAEEDSPVQTEEEARCWSGRIVDGIGEDRLVELGVSAENVGDIDQIDFSDSEVDTLVDGLFDCTDVEAAFAEQFTEDFGEEGAACMAEAMDQEMVSDMMKSSFSGDDAELPDDFFQAFLDIAAECDLPLN